MSFASRWVHAPDHVSEAEPGLPAGFRSAGVACGLKPSGGLRVTFTPHLVPIAHGELVSCYVTRADGIEVGPAYEAAYANEPWVEVVEGPPGMQEVRETNFCRISVHEDTRTNRIIVFATIDNLYKGTSSQAVQNLNLMFHIEETVGLL